MANYFSAAKGENAHIVPFANVAFVSIVGGNMYVYIKGNADLDEPVCLPFKDHTQALEQGQIYLDWLEGQDLSIVGLLEDDDCSPECDC